MDIKRIIGYEKLDNMLTGLALGFAAIILAYYGQINYYAVDRIGVYISEFQTPFLKLSLLGALFLFLLFNYFDKTYAMRGVLLSVIITGIYLVIKIYVL
jgi:hypothetical protein